MNTIESCNQSWNVVASNANEMYYLVGRGKPLGIVGGFPIVSNLIDEYLPKVEALLKITGAPNDITSVEPIPFVFKTSQFYDWHGLKCQWFTSGYAATPTILELFKWISLEADVPDKYHDAIVGMLCGYDPISIDKFCATRHKDE